MTSLSDRTPFPTTVDSTILTAFDSCARKGQLSYLEHWKPKSESVHLVAGGAFAKGIEVARKVYYEGVAPVWEKEEKIVDGSLKSVWKVKDEIAVPPGDQGTAQDYGLMALICTYGDFECPTDSAKSCERTAGALEYYFSQYPLGEDGMEPLLLANGKRAIEFSFATPLPFNHPVTGDPILYTGRADMLAHFANGRYSVDEKTTSSLGASWPRQWEMRAQFTGYNWAAREQGIQLDGTIVRGVSILKTKYDTMQVVTNRAQWEVERWLFQVTRILTKMEEMWRKGYFDVSLGSACGEYGGCSFLQICKSPNPEDWLPMYFHQKVWDPLAREEVNLEEWNRIQRGETVQPQ